MPVQYCHLATAIKTNTAARVVQSLLLLVMSWNEAFKTKFLWEIIAIDEG